MLAKIKNGFIVFPPEFITDKGMIIYNPNESLLKQRGFYEMSEDELAQAVLDLVHPPKKYSKKKIIDTLGAQWAALREKLDAENLLDTFIVEDKILENDNRFSDFLESVNCKLNGKLDLCIEK